MKSILGTSLRFLGFLLLVACPMGVFARSGTERKSAPTLGTFIRHPAMTGNLATVLGQFARTYGVPVVAELAQPLPSAELPAGTYTAWQALDLLVQERPDYAWEDRGGVPLVYNKRVFAASANPMNTRLKEFRMPSNLGDLKVMLPMAVEMARTGKGGLISGIVPADAAAVPLRAATLHDVTAREVLVRAAQETGAVFSLMLFPNDTPQSRKEEDETYRNWTFETLQSLASHPVLLRSYPAKHM